MSKKEQSEIRYLSPVDIDKTRREKYCRFKKNSVLLSFLEIFCQVFLLVYYHPDLKKNQ